jgi:membrane-associated protease RseP (regulator of RpoE activity)
MQSSPPDRRSLFDVAAAGPLAGLVLAVPAVIVGFHLSTVAPQDSSGGGMVLGSSLLLSLLSKITLGVLPNDANIVLHPVGFAGWIGLLVTAMNLLPAGQLDGGHVTYALFGRRYIWVSRLTVAVILTLGVTRLWDGWLVWGILLLFMGVRHPPPVDPDTPLDAKRKFLGWFLLGTLAVTFIPVPFSFQEPDKREERREPETPETLQRTRGKQVFHERATELESVFHDHHAPGGGALHL